MTARARRDAAAGGYVDAGGLRVYYRDLGEGPPLVLVHGGLGTGDLWSEPAVAELARRHRVLIPDSRGHGRTGNPAGMLRYHQMADDVAAFAAALGLRRPLVLGYSDGAQVAVELGLRHPALAAALVIGGVVTRPGEAYLRFLGELGFPEPGAVDLAEVERALGDFFPVVRTAHRHARGGDALRAYLAQISELWHSLRAYTDEELAGIGAPSLVIVGDRDFPSLDESLRLYRLLPRGELAVIPNADHAAVERGPFWDPVMDFLSRQHPAGGEETAS
jgi:pimeloyl-ACP methyl ester carboxylesterase